MTWQGQQSVAKGLEDVMIYLRAWGGPHPIGLASKNKNMTTTKLNHAV